MQIKKLKSILPLVENFFNPKIARFTFPPIFGWFTFPPIDYMPKMGQNWPFLAQVDA